MNERYQARAALFGIVDFGWTISGAINGKEDVGMQPLHLTFNEARMLSDFCSVIPQRLLPKIMPSVVRQFGGPNGEESYKKLIEAQNIKS